MVFLQVRILFAVFLIVCIGSGRIAAGDSNDEAVEDFTDLPASDKNEEVLMGQMDPEHLVALQMALDGLKKDIFLGKQVGTRPTAIRRITLDPDLPAGLRQHLHLKLLALMRAHSRQPVVTCEVCRFIESYKGSDKIGDKKELALIKKRRSYDKLAESLKIKVWVDAELVKQPGGMTLHVLAYTVDSKEFLWGGSYQAELKVPEPPPKPPDNVVWAVQIGLFSLPNVHETTKLIGVELRSGESIADGFLELGSTLLVVADPQMALSTTTEADLSKGDTAGLEPIAASVIPNFRYAVGIAPNFEISLLGSSGLLAKSPQGTEGVNIRFGLRPGLLIAPNYTSITLRGNLVVMVARSHIVEFGVIYCPETTLSVLDNRYKYTTPGGTGVNLSFGLQF